MIYVDDAGLMKMIARGSIWWPTVLTNCTLCRHARATRTCLPPRRPASHYDVPDDLRQRAISLGAMPISTRDAVRISRKLRDR